MIHLLSACFCLGCSSIYHLCGIKSETTKKLLSRLDYGGISVLIMGSSYPPIIYGYSCQPVFWVRNFFLGLITTTSVVCFIVTLMPKFHVPKYRPLRGYMFIILGLSAGIPFIQMTNATEYQSTYILPGFSFWPWIIGGATYIGGALIYVFRFPERFFPRKFDLFGSSH